MSSTTPFIKWPGGKAGLLPQLYPLLPPDVADRRHVELFVGGGALFFARSPPRALLADVNARLVETYCVVRDYVESLIASLADLREMHTHAPVSTYYDTRDRFNTPHASMTSIDRAASFVYLNKTCFNGLYRENKRGHFNASLGSYKDPAICDRETLQRASRALAGVDVQCRSYEQAEARCGPRDFVYLDPPYEPAQRDGFTTYSSGGFGQDDQRALAQVFRSLDARGSKVMLSNSDVPFIRELYEGYEIETVHARRSINTNGKGRGAVPEVVVRNYRSAG